MNTTTLSHVRPTAQIYPYSPIEDFADYVLGILSKERMPLAQHPLAKRAKDLGSAAQLVSLLALALVWLVVLADFGSGT